MKRVLYITYYFPPSGGSGVQRGLKMVKYLPASNWQPIVLTVDPDHAAYPILDPALEDDLPTDTRITRTRSWDPYAMYASMMGRKKKDAVGVGFLGADHASTKEKLARWVRANLFLPDARVGWVRFARKAALELAGDPGFDAIVSSGPPHSAHLIGRDIAKATGKPWVADLRDAWPDAAYAEMLPTTRWALKRDLSLRNRALKRANACIAVTEDLASTMQNATGAPFSVIRNGFDPEDFAGVEPMKSEGFTIVHTGSLAPARDPEPIWNVLANPENEARWPELKLHFVGNVDPLVLDSARKAGAIHRVQHTPYVPHHEALAQTLGANLLLLPINRVNNAAGIVTGKIYEYLASGRPVLGIGDPNGEAARLLSSSEAGKMLAWDDEEGMALELDRHLEAWRTGQSLNGANPNTIQAFSRKEQAASLAVLLETLISPSA